MPVLAAAALAACTPEPAELYADAQDSYAQNDFNAARVALVAALQAEPDNAEMIVLLARTQIALGNGEGAAARLEQLPAEMLDQPDIAVLRGEAEVLKGRSDEAIALVEGIETSSADRVRALANIGSGDLLAAADAFAIGASRDKRDPRLLASFARFELLRGSTDSAAELVDLTLEEDPRSVEAYLVRADLNERENDLPAALEAYDAALGLHAANLDGLLGKGMILARMGENEGAEELAGQLRDADPESVGAAVISAQVAANEGDWAKVRSTLQPFETALFDVEQGAVLYSEALIEVGVPGLALNYLKPIFEQQPGWRKVRRLVARAQLASDDPAGALATIRATASRPDATSDELELAANAARQSGSASASGFEERVSEPTAQWVGGELAKGDRALRNRQWGEAERAYLAIIERTGGRNALVLNNLAFAQEKQGKTDDALKNALSAAEMEPDNASILDTAGWLLVQTGSKARGIEMLERAAQIDPANRTVARHLSEARAL